MSIDHGTDRSVRPGAPARPGTGAAPIELVELGEAHHPWVAAFHADALPHGLFPRMGRRFVAHWHRAHVASPHGVGYVAVRDGEPVGFALGSTDRAAHVAWILSHRRRRLVVAAVPALARRPRLAWTFVRTRAAAYARRLLRPGGRVVTAPVVTGPTPVARPVAVLEAVAVLPEVRGQRIGSRLVDLVLADASRSGADRVELVTKDGEGGAAGFYERGSWERLGRHEDRDGDGVLRFGIDPRRPRNR